MPLVQQSPGSFSLVETHTVRFLQRRWAQDGSCLLTRVWELNFTEAEGVQGWQVSSSSPSSLPSEGAAGTVEATIQVAWARARHYLGVDKAWFPVPSALVGLDCIESHPTEARDEVLPPPIGELAWALLVLLYSRGPSRESTPGGSLGALGAISGGLEVAVEPGVFLSGLGTLFVPSSLLSSLPSGRRTPEVTGLSRDWLRRSLVLGGGKGGPDNSASWQLKTDLRRVWESYTGGCVLLPYSGGGRDVVWRAVRSFFLQLPSVEVRWKEQNTQRLRAWALGNLLDLYRRVGISAQTGSNGRVLLSVLGSMGFPPTESTPEEVMGVPPSESLAPSGVVLVDHVSQMSLSTAESLLQLSTSGRRAPLVLLPFCVDSPDWVSSPWVQYLKEREAVRLLPASPSAGVRCVVQWLASDVRRLGTDEEAAEKLWGYFGGQPEEAIPEWVWAGLLASARAAKEGTW
jgi:hypothetical protein